MKKKLNLKKVNFIPVNVPKIFKEDKKYINDCLKTNWISSEGNYVKNLKKIFLNLTKENMELQYQVEPLH